MRGKFALTEFPLGTNSQNRCPARQPLLSNESGIPLLSVPASLMITSNGSQVDSCVSGIFILLLRPWDPATQLGVAGGGLPPLLAEYSTQWKGLCSGFCSIVFSEAESSSSLNSVSLLNSLNCIARWWGGISWWPSHPCSLQPGGTSCRGPYVMLDPQTPFTSLIFFFPTRRQAGSKGCCFQLLCPSFYSELALHPESLCL